MNKDIVDTIVYLIQSLGFPIFVAVWMLVKSDKSVKENTEAIKSLTDLIKTRLSNPEVKEGEHATPNPNP